MAVRPTAVISPPAVKQHQNVGLRSSAVFNDLRYIRLLSQQILSEQLSQQLQERSSQNFQGW